MGAVGVSVELWCGLIVMLRDDLTVRVATMVRRMGAGRAMYYMFGFMYVRMGSVPTVSGNGDKLPLRQR